MKDLGDMSNDELAQLGIHIHAQKDFTQDIHADHLVKVTEDFDTMLVGDDQYSMVKLQSRVKAGEVVSFEVGDSTLLITANGVFMSALRLDLASAGGSPMPMARVGDFHSCPKTNSSDQSHVGGKIASGSPDVFIDGKPAARMGDPLICKHGPMDHIAQGNHTLLINDMPAAHLGFKTAHGGVIQQGSPTASGGIHASSGSAKSHELSATNENTITYEWQTIGDESQAMKDEHDNNIQQGKSPFGSSHIDAIEKQSASHIEVSDGFVEKAGNVKLLLNDLPPSAQAGDAATSGAPA